MRDDDVVALDAAVEVGESVRPAGDDLAPGDVVFGPGCRAERRTPRRAGHVRANGGAGRARAARRGDVHRRRARRGAVALAPGQIRTRTGPRCSPWCARPAASRSTSAASPTTRPPSPRPSPRASATATRSITSGGVSMGDVDLVKVVLDRVGDMRWMQVAIRPGQAARVRDRGRARAAARCPCSACPGNPVSSVVSFELFARPGLRRMMGFGDADLDRPRVAAVADEALRRTADGKTHFARVVALLRGRRAGARALGGRARARTTSAPLVGRQRPGRAARRTRRRAPAGSVDVLLIDHL